jgi:excinuclease ABC subunit A
MQFLADVELVCDECKGTRFKSSILEIKYKGLNVHEVLQLTVVEAIAFFHDTPRLVTRLRLLDEVGLGYLRLGQSATTLSGGEAQRVKLAAHLAQSSNNGTLFICDEPTTGLHFDDVRRLLEVLHRLTDLGNTVIIIEHNLDVVRNADWILDLGPEGGEDGGQIVAEGTPEFVATVAHSHTGEFLRRYYTQTGSAPAASLAQPQPPMATNGNQTPTKTNAAATPKAPRKRKAELVS